MLRLCGALALATCLGAPGAARAQTVNGSIDATIAGAAAAHDHAFQTVNGNVTVTVRGELNAQLSATTVTGSIESDYPVTISGRFGPRSATGTIGAGGRRLNLQTVNGSIRLRRG
jgi:DUF4097 and DUF4098 domain-containing protein YvlB